MSTVVAAIYARISQDKHKDGPYKDLNVDDQIENCRARIESLGWQVGEIYRDDSISAYNGDTRPAFERLIRDAPAMVVSDKQDRLTRGVLDTLKLKAANVEGHFLDGGRLAFSTADEETFTLIRSVIDGAEGRKKSERQKSANLRYAKAGKYRGSIRPFGQTTKGEWVDGEAEAVRTAAEDLLNDSATTFYTIAKRWNAAGLLTPQTGKQGGKQWTSGTVRNYFTRPRLYGVQEYNGTLYELADWKPLLTKDTFDQLQTLINSKRTGQRGVSKGRGDAHELTGIAKCECGRGMNVGYRGAKGTPRIYRCPTVGHQSVTAEHLERTVMLHALQLMSGQDEAKAEAEEATNSIRDLLDSKRVLQATHEAWIDEAVTAGLSPALIAKRETVHAEECSRIDAEVMSLRQALGVNLLATEVTMSWDDGVLNVDHQRTGWESLPVPQRRDVLMSLFTGVHVARGQQGQRFKPERVSFSYTPLGDRLYDQWAENWSPLEVLGEVP